MKISKLKYFFLFYDCPSKQKDKQKKNSVLHKESIYEAGDGNGEEECAREIGESRLAAVLISPFEAKCGLPRERTVCPGMADRGVRFPNDTKASLLWSHSPRNWTSTRTYSWNCAALGGRETMCC